MITNDNIIKPRTDYSTDDISEMYNFLVSDEVSNALTTEIKNTIDNYVSSLITVIIPC